VIFQIPHFELHGWISAFDTKPESVEDLFRNAAEKHPSVSLQLVDLDRVPGQRYLLLATVNALESFHSKQPIAKTLGMELLLYIAGEKQITEALGIVGVTPRTRRVAAIAVGASAEEISAAANSLAETLGLSDNDQLLDDWPLERIKNVRSGFEIGEKELKAVIRKREPVSAAIERLAVERSAMLAARR
jgi:KEOPS complex subunit Cgi121